MAGSLFINSLIFQITVCIVLINETSSYHEFLLEDGNLCKLREDADDAVIKLGAKDASSRIVTQKTYFASWTGRYNFKCSFQVKTYSDYGIYAVIQSLNFRKNETTEECKDYVKFEPSQNIIDKFFTTKVKRSVKYCGKLYASRLPDLYGEDVEYTDIVSENSYRLFSNSMIVTIYVGTDRLLPHEKLDIKIAFTAFRKDCSPRLREEYIECNRCEWIWKGLEKDNVQNCPYVSCKDEDHCKNFGSHEVRDIVSSGTGTKVTIGAVAAIIVFFITFASCLCVCRKSQRCCWSQPSSNSSRMEMNRTRQRNAYEENDTPYGEIPAGPATPSAPPLTDVKDLPPSYDSLFPDK